MPTTFSTLWGNALNGIRVNWNNDPAVLTNTGDRQLNINFNLYMYAMKPTAGLKIGWTDASANPPKDYIDTLFVTNGWDTSTALTEKTASPIPNSMTMPWYFVLTWANPTASAIPKFDGFCAKFSATFTSSALATDSANNPKNPIMIWTWST